MTTPTAQAETAANVEIIATRAHRKGMVNLVARRNCSTIAVVTLHPQNAARVYGFAEDVNVDVNVVREAIQKSQQENAFAPLPIEVSDLRLTLRGLAEPRANGRVISGQDPFRAMQTALAITDYQALEPVIEWEETRFVAALDLDYHDVPIEQRRQPDQLAALVKGVHPRPPLWWVTHGRGLRLIYVAMGGLTAEELAACAALTLRSLDASATFEVKSQTRHPCYPRPDHPPAGPVQCGVPTAELGELARWLARDVSESLVQEWLAERGLESGCTYGHHSCPIDPATPSHGEPVYIGEGGVFCHACAARGLCLGSKRAGFFPWPALIAGGLSPKLRTAARHFCHWEHAQHIIAESVGLTGTPACLCYSALLKAIHGPQDPRTKLALFSGWGLVRMDSYWATADLRKTHASSGLVDRLKVLPVVKQLLRHEDGTCELITNQEELGIFQGVDDLSDYGYPRAHPVRGMKIFWHFRANPDPSVVRAVVLPEDLQAPRQQAYQPRYVPASKRMGQQEAEQVLNSSFPGINLSYLKLLIAARGCAEGESGQPPRIAVDGPSGAGKDMTVKIAAALIGDSHRDVPWVPQLKDFHLGLYEAGMNAGLVTSTEIIKLIKANRGDVLASLSGLLNFDRDTSVRKLYTGPVATRQLPVIVITDTSFPRELHCDGQLGRRFVHVHLERKVDWQRSAQTSLQKWRTLHRDHADAANALVSSIIDEFFAGDEPMVFEDIARELGFTLLNQSGDMGLDPQAELLALFQACCSQQAVVAPSSTWKGQGWRLIRRECQNPLSTSWQAVCDNMGEGFISSRRVKEADWARLLGADSPVECDLAPNGGSSLAIRFRTGNPRSPKARYNQDISRGPQPPGPPTEPPSDPPPPPQGPPVGQGPQVSVDTLEPALVVAAVNQPPEGNLAFAPVFIDLETRSRCNLQQQGGRRYAEHPTTEILTVAALIDDCMLAWTPTLAEPLPENQLGLDPLHGVSRIETFAGPNLPEPLADAIREGRPFCAHNAFGFDARVWSGRGLPPPVEWVDTLPDARVSGLPGKLDELGQLLLGVGKDEEGKKLIKRLCQPNQRGELIPFNRQNALKVLKYNTIDTWLLSRLYPLLQGHAEPEVVALDQSINGRGIYFDVPLAQALINLEAQEKQTACNEVEQLTKGAIKATDLRKGKLIQQWLHNQGLDLPNMQKETLERLLLDRPELDPAVRRVLEVRLSINRVTSGKLESAVAACDEDGRLRDLVLYHGAHTGRWTGCGVQPHNLPRPHPDLKDLGPLLATANDPAQFRQLLPPKVTLADAISALIRPCFRAAPGKVLIIADYSSIEARGTAWCADEKALLELFACGGDAYCDLASRIFGRRITKEMKRERSVGKEAVLGCGYGMGAPTFAHRCAENGIDLGQVGTTAEEVVKGYRETYSAISGGVNGRGNGLWQTVEQAAWDAVLRQRSGWAGRCEFLREGGSLVIRLPSGRRLFYRNARLEWRIPHYCQQPGMQQIEKPTLVYDDPKEAGKVTYGGSLTENIVQAICRDLLVAAMFECQRQGLAIVLHVHDELVLEVAADQADEALRKLLTIMTTPPAWAPGLPIEVEGFCAERYYKVPPAGTQVVKARNGEILP